LNSTTVQAVWEEKTPQIDSVILGSVIFKKSSLENQKRTNEHYCWVQRVTQLVQITNPVVVARSSFKIENHIFLHQYFMHIFYLGYKDRVDAGS